MGCSTTRVGGTQIPSEQTRAHVASSVSTSRAFLSLSYTLVDMTGLLSSGLLNYMVCVCGVVICTKGVGTSAGGMLRR